MHLPCQALSWMLGQWWTRHASPPFPWTWPASVPSRRNFAFRPLQHGTSQYTYHLFILHASSTTAIRCRDSQTAELKPRSPVTKDGYCLKSSKRSSWKKWLIRHLMHNYGGWAWVTLQRQKARKHAQITAGLSKRQLSWTVKTSSGYIWGNYQKRKRKKKASTQMKFSNTAKQSKLISGCVWGMVAGNTWEGVPETFWGDGHGLHLGNTDGDTQWSKIHWTGYSRSVHLLQKKKNVNKYWTLVNI